MLYFPCFELTFIALEISITCIARITYIGRKYFSFVQICFMCIALSVSPCRVHSGFFRKIIFLTTRKIRI